MLNDRVIRDRLAEIDENVAILEELSGLSESEFCSDPKVYKLAERCFQLAIECILGIAHYLIAQNDWPRPQSNSEALIILAEQGVIPKDFATKIAPMINFRNILVHAYLGIDHHMVYQHLCRIGDFRTFQRHLLRYLKTRSSGEQRRVDRPLPDPKSVYSVSFGV